LQIADDPLIEACGLALTVTVADPEKSAAVELQFASFIAVTV
jgi:hypothetical protein